AGAPCVKVLTCIELAEKQDVSDYIATGATKDQLLARIDTEPFWQNDHRKDDRNVADRGQFPETAAIKACELVLRCMADVLPEKVEWLWPVRIALGKQNITGGEPKAKLPLRLRRR